MKSAAAIGLALAATTAIAAPHAKRDVVWVTETNVVTQVVDVTETVWANAADATSTTAASSSTSLGAAAAALAQKYPANDNNRNQPEGGLHAYSSSSVSTVFIKPSPATTAAPASEPTTTTPVPYTTPSPAAPSTTTTTTPPVAAPTTPSSAPAPSSPSPVSSSAPSAPAYSSPPSSGGSGSGGCSTFGAGGECSNARFSYYEAGMGACGISNTDNDPIFAFPEAAFDAMTPNGNPNNNPLCGKMITITAYDGSKVSAKLVDRCPGCQANQLDLTPSLWKTVSKGDPKADGIASGYTWEWQ